MTHDPWADPVLSWARSQPGNAVKMADILGKGLEIPQELQVRTIQMRVAKIMREDGWVSHIIWGGKKTSRTWSRPVRKCCSHCNPFFDMQCHVTGCEFYVPPAAKP